MAGEAEKCGWDGFFLWDHTVDERNQRLPIADAYTTLAAIAVKTKRIRIGLTVSALPRRRPWIVARQAASIDQLSGGRFTLGVGLGFSSSLDYTIFGEDARFRVRAEKVDEELEVITGLWKGKPFSYRGKHYRLEETSFLPTPIQKPRIPIWVGGFWPRKAPFRRAAKWDGVIPLKLPVRLLNPDDLREVLAYIKSQRGGLESFDSAVIGWTVSKDPKKNSRKIWPYVEAGMTWWLESLYTKRDSPDGMRERIRKGPPRLI
jgi:alkanesulfonate monooxygenase SsuD/methylene tetrahydromethanopterin reductase-like flavin-dependent oxidoreductase (luciferase family)